MGCGASCSDDVMKASLLVASVPCGCLALWTIISMTCRKNPDRQVQKRDLVQLVAHLSSTLWMLAVWVKTNRDWDEESDLYLCTTVIVLTHSGRLVQNFAMLLVWYIRFRTLIGPIYPYWVQYPTMLMTLGVPVFFVYDSVTLSGGFKEIGSRGAGCYYSGSLDNFVLVAGILLVVPASILLVMFILPLSYYAYLRTSEFVSFMMKHMVVTMLDIIIQVSFMISYETFDQDANRPGFHLLLSARNIGVLVSNLLLIYVFADWRERLFYVCGGCYHQVMLMIKKISIREKKDPVARIIPMCERWERALFMDDVLTLTQTTLRVEKIQLGNTGSRGNKVAESTISKSSLSGNSSTINDDICDSDLRLKN